MRIMPAFVKRTIQEFRVLVAFEMLNLKRTHNINNVSSPLGIE